MDVLVRASGLCGYPALMRAMGFDPMRLLRRYHIDEGALDSDDAMVSLRAVVHLLEASAAQAECGDFGLRLSQYQSIDVLGPLSIALQNAPTIRAAMNFAARYINGLDYTVRERSPIANDAVEVSIEIRLSRQRAQRQASDLWLADIHNFTARRRPIRASRGVHSPHADCVAAHLRALLWCQGDGGTAEG